jgi:hypothetical protein
VIIQTNTTLSGSALTFNQTVKGDGASAHDLTLQASNGNITFNGALGDATALIGAVTLNTASDNVFNAPVRVASLLSDDSGTGVGRTVIHTNAISTTGAQTFNDDVVIQSDTTLSGSALTFNQTVKGNDPVVARQLIINAQGGDATFNGVIGSASARLGVFKVTASDHIFFNENIVVGHLETGTSGTTTFAQTLATTTSGASMLFGNDVVVVGPTFTFDATDAGALPTGANITFAKSLSSATAGVTQVSIQAGTAGVVRFMGAVGQDASHIASSLSDLTVSAGGGIVLSGGVVQTTGSQTYNNPVTLGASVNLMADRIDWGRVIATVPHVNLSMSSQGTQVLTDISITGDLSVTTGLGGVTGGVNQAAGTALTIAGTSTFTADTKTAQVANLASEANVFGGAVSFKPAHGGAWFSAVLVSQSPLILGETRITTDLSLKSTGGEITQVGSIEVGGKTDIVATAGGVTLADPTNKLVGIVNVNTAGGLKLSTSGPLTMGQVKTGGDNEILAVGKIDLGKGAYGGKLKVNSTGSEIMQSGAINFAGDTNFDAGNAKIELFNPSNLWKGSIVYKGGIVMINHPQLMNATNAGTLVVRIETSMQAIGTQRVTTPASTTAAGSESDLTVSTVRPASLGQTGLVAVTVSTAAASAGKGFAFALSEHIAADLTKTARVAVTQLDGRPLPEWLRYDTGTQKVIATSPPPGAFPVQIKASVGGVDTVIVITEQPK